jgi:hypothetical protein
MGVRDERRRLLAKIHRSPNRLYVLNTKLAQPVFLAAQMGEEAWRWHARFGHTGFTVLRKMATQQLM